MSRSACSISLLLLARASHAYSPIPLQVRDYLLREFKLTAKQYRERFRTAVKSLTETYTLFGSRVKNLFSYYLQNREAKTLEQVIDLLVSDRIKETLSPACLRHVLGTEGTVGLVRKN